MSASVFVKGLAFGAIVIGFITTAAQASSSASPCKGLAQSACTAKAECSWVAATKRKDGREVKAYCRAKARKAATSTTAKK